ncbi:MAG TPA: hypothetical protein VEH06_13850 [Candidatus Bathyarchaeia archaeon]|nr:hypothetical protein [Candidatus Bathyarchaeia archaeon]
MAFYDETVMLLGAGNQGEDIAERYLDYRKRIRLELIELGYKKVMIMEDELGKFLDISLDDKFHRIVKEYDPRLFIAFFHIGARMDGVTFEIGWLCSHYNANELEKRLLIFNERDYKWNMTTWYISSLFPNTGPVTVDESDPRLKASVLINQRVLHLILKT